MATYTTRLVGSAGEIQVDVHYRIRPWGVDLDEIYIFGTDSKLRLTPQEYFVLTKEISAHLAKEAKS